MKKCTTDLLIIGAGPAGLSAAINAASEGLSVSIIDSSSVLGGQARESAAIENYPGFPGGVSGEDLMHLFVTQAIKFGTIAICPTSAARLRKDNGSLFVTTEDYNEHESRCVLLTLGLNYRRLQAKNIAQFMGRGVFYGVPAGVAAGRKKINIIVVGGANSAGQATLNLAQNPNAKVRLLARGELKKGMSQYLIDRIRATPNVEVCEGCVVDECIGVNRLERVTYSQKGYPRTVPAECMCIYIGAQPRTLWLDGTLAMDEHKFIKTGDRIDQPLPFMTSMHGVFAAGDVRSGSTKRISAAIGEGSAALQNIHQFLGA